MASTQPLKAPDVVTGKAVLRTAVKIYWALAPCWVFLLAWSFVLLSICSFAMIGLDLFLSDWVSFCGGKVGLYYYYKPDSSRADFTEAQSECDKEDPLYALCFDNCGAFNSYASRGFLEFFFGWVAIAAFIFASASMIGLIRNMHLGRMHYLVVSGFIGLAAWGLFTYIYYSFSDSVPGAVAKDGLQLAIFLACFLTVLMLFGIIVALRLGAFRRTDTTEFREPTTVEYTLVIEEVSGRQYDIQGHQDVQVVIESPPCWAQLLAILFIGCLITAMFLILADLAEQDWIQYCGGQAGPFSFVKEKIRYSWSDMKDVCRQVSSPLSQCNNPCDFAGKFDNMMLAMQICGLGTAFIFFFPTSLMFQVVRSPQPLWLKRIVYGFMGAAATLWIAEVVMYGITYNLVKTEDMEITRGFQFAIALACVFPFYVPVGVFIGRKLAFSAKIREDTTLLTGVYKPK